MRRYVSLLLLGASGLLCADRASVAAMQALQQFVDELPIPPSIQVGPTSGSRSGKLGKDPAEIVITLNQFKTKYHRDMPETTVWGYNGSSPGPTIDVERGQTLRVHWKNELPTVHFIQSTIGGAMADPSMPDVRNVTHLHGAVVTESDPMDRVNNNDGWPDAWNIPGQEQIAEYPNDQEARALWFHDHAMLTTGRNVYSGLMGLYLIRDSYERSLNLPSGKFEVPIEFQTRSFNDDGSLYYPKVVQNEVYGNAMAVNGKIWPFINVEPRKYRFRFLNASNARTIALKLIDQATQSAGPAFYQIGSDGGFLENTAVLGDPNDPSSPRLVMSPAERMDVIIDFSKFAGRSFVLNNNFQPDHADGELPIPTVMLFQVGAAVSAPDTSSLPMQMRAIPRLSPQDATTTRQIILAGTTMPDGSQMLLMNGKQWSDPIVEKPVLGTTEVWELANTTGDLHPFHIHLVQFQVLDRRPFDVDAYLKTGTINYTGPAVPPDSNEMGWKDVIRATQSNVTRIIMRFAPYAGYYVYHCHILEHEDMGMMRPFQVVAPPASLMSRGLTIK